MPLSKQVASGHIFPSKSRCARRVFDRLSVRVNMRQCRPLYGPSIGDVCQIKAYIDLFVSVFLRCARGTNPPPNDTPSWERNYGMPLRCAIQRGIKLAVMVMQSIRVKHVQAEGGRPPSRRPVSIQTSLIVRDSNHTSRSIDLPASKQS